MSMQCRTSNITEPMVNPTKPGHTPGMPNQGETACSREETLVGCGSRGPAAKRPYELPEPYSPLAFEFLARAPIMPLSLVASHKIAVFAPCGGLFRPGMLQRPGHPFPTSSRAAH